MIPSEWSPPSPKKFDRYEDPSSVGASRMENNGERASGLEDPHGERIS
jgi:hypothetical protein